jgi:hypothetical protein
LTLQFHQLPDETLEAWWDRLAAVEPGGLTTHQQKIRTLCLADIEWQIRLNVRTLCLADMGGQTSQARRFENWEWAEGTKRLPVVEQFALVWDKAGLEAREQILLHINRSRPGQ